MSFTYMNTMYVSMCNVASSMEARHCCVFGALRVVTFTSCVVPLLSNRLLVTQLMKAFVGDLVVSPRFVKQQ
jgi:hypothetical protein